MSAVEGVRSTERVKRLMAAISVLFIVDMALYSAVTPLLPDLQRRLDLSGGQLGILMGCYPIGLVVAAIPAGQLSARIGAKQVSLIGAGGLAIACVAMGVNGPYAVFCVLRLAQGASAACTWAGGLAWLSAVTPPERRGAVIGTAMAAAGVGGVVGPAMGAAASALSPWLVFGAIGLVAALAGVTIWCHAEPPAEQSVSLIRVVRRLATPHAAPLVWIVLFCAGLIGALMVRLPLRLDYLGTSAALIGIAFTAAAIVEMAAGPFLGMAYDRIGSRIPVAACLLVIASGLTFFVLVDDYRVLLAVLVLSLPAVMLMLTPAMAGLAELAGGAGLPASIIFGATNFLWAVGEASGALIAGWGLSDPRSHLGEIVIVAVALGSVPLVMRSTVIESSSALVEGDE